MAHSRTTEYRKTRHALNTLIRDMEDGDRPVINATESEAIEAEAHGDGMPMGGGSAVSSQQSFEDDLSSADEWLLSDDDGDNAVFSDASCGEENEHTESEHDRHPDDRSEACKALASWAVRFNISHTALLALLAILSILGLSVPRDSRTLLQTPTSKNIVKMGAGELVYFGIARGLENVLRCTTQRLSDVRLKVNVDGLPLFKSTSTALWPILGMVNKHVFTIAVYCGKDKPPLTEFLSAFVQECLDLFRSGISLFALTSHMITHWNWTFQSHNLL